MCLAGIALDLVQSRQVLVVEFGNVINQDFLVLILSTLLAFSKLNQLQLLRRRLVRREKARSLLG